MIRKKVAVFTASGCRACENALLDLHCQVNDLSRWAEMAFWPYVLGSSWKDLERQPDLDVCFFSGAIQTWEDREAALRLREKSDILVACGACAAFGGMPGLGNLTPAEPAAAKGETAGTDSSLPLPCVGPRISSLGQIVPTDYVVPGCPPTQALLWSAFQALVCGPESLARLSYSVARLPEKISGALLAGVLPPKGSVFSGERAVCANCSRVKEEKKFATALRPYQAYEASGRCLLEQGLICLGIVTREGCGGICTGVGQPCRGCFGNPEAVYDPGAKMVSAIGSTFEPETPPEIQAMVDSMVDLAGTFYRYTQPTQCALARKRPKDEEWNRP